MVVLLLAVGRDRGLLSGLPVGQEGVSCGPDGDEGLLARGLEAVGALLELAPEGDVGVQPVADQVLEVMRKG